MPPSLAWQVIKWGVWGVVAVVILLAAHFALWHFLGDRIYEYQRERLLDALVEANPGLERHWIQTEPFANPWEWLVERDTGIRTRLRRTMSMLPGIGALFCNVRELVDITPLAGMPLEWLNLSATQVTDLAPLAGMPLKELYLMQPQVSDLTPLSGMPLERLSLEGTQVSDLTPLTGMPLKHLKFFRTQVTDLTPLSEMPLRYLWLTGTPVSDLTPLAGMPLEWLELRGTQVSDLTPLAGMPLEYLEILETPAAKLPLPDWLPRGCFVRW